MATVSCTSQDFSGKVTLPSSKSISNRLLIMQELSGGKLVLNHLSRADDTVLMQQCLKTYRNSDHLFTDNAGTVMRFMTALMAVSEGKWTLAGSPRMNQRPIGPLVEALQQLGANIQYTGAYGFPPLLIEGCTLKGGAITIDAGTSSQYISALLMVAPLFEQPLNLELTGNIVSAPYIDMTIALMKDCKIPISRHENIITVTPSTYQPAVFTVESDWSSAAFFYALAAISESASFFLPGLQEQSLQGDAIVQRWFESLGVRTSFKPDGVRIVKTGIKAPHVELDFSGHPDLFLPMAIACAGSEVNLSAEGLQNLAHKESNRLKGAALALKELWFDVHYTDSEFFLKSGNPWTFLDVIPTLSVQGDHRMAMSFALLAERFPEIELDETEVVSKSFPGYFNILRSLGFRIDKR